MKLLIIPDGNRRWAERNGVSFDEGYRRMAEKLGMAADFLLENNIGDLWVLCNTVKHWERPKAEVRSYWNNFLLVPSLTKARDKVKVVVGGNKTLFFEDYRERFETLERATLGKEGITLHYLMNYSGVGAIAMEINRLIAKGVKEISGQMIMESLGVPPDLDVVLKTGADGRNYICGLVLPYLTNIEFSDKLWPELEKADLEQLVLKYGAAGKNL